ncbi:MAG: hypothetical protein ACFFDT_17805, partial [Candidatus Hodarchaeota archaeon]
MGPIVPSDLVEYPIINYYKFRNRGKVTDTDLSQSFISIYGRYYQKNPRNFFIESFKPKISEINWS